MVATLNGKSTVTTALDATTPFTQQSSGEGRAARLLSVEDVVAIDAAGLGTVGSYYRLCRVPANAKIKKVEVFAEKLDSNASSTLVLEFGMVFSDSTIDGTPVAYQGKFPDTSGNGVAVASTGTRNALFGTVTAPNNAVIPITEITHKGTLSTLLNLTQRGLAKIFGFITAQGYDQPCPGYMDLYAYVSTVSATPAAGNLYGRVSYAE